MKNTKTILFYAVLVMLGFSTLTFTSCHKDPPPTTYLTYTSFMKLWRIERDEMHVKGLAARKAERDRVKQLKEMQKMLGPIPIEMYGKIPDPEALWKATNEVWIAEEAKKRN